MREYHLATPHYCFCEGG